MTIDFQQIRQQVIELGHNAPKHAARMWELQVEATRLLAEYADELQYLRQKVERVVKTSDPSLRCALPVEENLITHIPTPPQPKSVTMLASDGSQIYLDRHSAVEYFLINIGAITMETGGPATPTPQVYSELFYGDEINNPGEYFDEDRISLMRDLHERRILAELASRLSPPVIVLTDGPLELWGAKTMSSPEQNRFRQSLDDYLQALCDLEDQSATAGGYVDKPSEDYVIRLLEIASQTEQNARQRPFFGVRDEGLYSVLLEPGERSAVFEVQSRAAIVYKRRRESLALHFFYLNVGRPEHPWLARVDIPGWVAHDPQKLETLHAMLVGQCRILGSRPYPYLLHRAHEIALVSREEKNQLETMIMNELRKHGITGQESHKQGLKSLEGKKGQRR